MWTLSQCRTLAASLAIVLLVGCANQTQQKTSPPLANKNSTRPTNVSISAGPGIFFFDHDTGNLWMYEDPSKPAVLVGKLESFDKPLVTKEMLAEQERDLAAHSPPTPPTVPPLASERNTGSPVAEQLNALPKNLWPSDGENVAKQALRGGWLGQNLVHGSGTFTGKLSSMDIDYNQEKFENFIVLHFEVGNVTIWGKNMTLQIEAPIDSLKPEDVIDWKMGRTVTVTGNVKPAAVNQDLAGGYSIVIITLDHAELKR